ncbi:MAG: hypothetical protein RIE86_26840 [Imperialibacter sp.]|uniref:alpha/beta hydrolase family protein n=1 Tax=Imperialibacter sp. TaxID=2038411 RepID=UPI0032EE3447
MRTFEIILLLVVSILPFVKRPIVRHVRANYVLVFLGVLLALHLIVEGWRWQMFPAYLLTLIVGWRVKVADATESPRVSFVRVVGYLGLIVLLLPGWALPKLLPVFSLPEPRGPYSVGTELVHVQTERDEIITKDATDKRELMYKIWYPSDVEVSSLKGEKYVDEGSRAGFSVKYGLPPSALNYLDRVKTYVYPNIPVADGPFPVLIFSHGYGSKATGYYALLTEMASQGYVIINMNHTYESLGATFPDGRVKYFDYDFQNEISAGSQPVVEPLIEAFKSDLTYEERHPIVREASKNYFMAGVNDRWAEDMIYTLDLLEKWNAEGALKGKLNLNQIGVFGHSVGGGASGVVATTDSRIKAAANLDGISWGNTIDSTYHIPFLYVSADWPAEHEDVNSHIYLNKSTDYFYESKLLKSGHPNFMDIPFMIPVQSLAGTGDIDPYQGMEIVTKLTTSFFDRHLRHLPGPDPEEIGKQYELLEMTVYKGDSIK